MNSRTNRLMRRLGLAGCILFAALLIASGLPGYHVEPLNLATLAGLITAFFGLPTWRNVQEARSDPNAYFHHHQDV